MDYTLELIVVPVSDIDRAKRFYTEQLGFAVDTDYSAGPDFRVVQLTPPGSACSISLMRNQAAGTLQGLQLCVSDIDVAREELGGRGAPLGEPFHFGANGQTTGHHPERANYGTFVSFQDPDGNTWLIQEVRRD